MDIGILQATNKQRDKEWDQGGVLDLSFHGNELAGETGEACNIIKKLERERLGLEGSRSTKEALAEELSDIIIVACNIANKAGIDLSDAVPKKFNATSEKNGFKTTMPAQSSRGSNITARDFLYSLHIWLRKNEIDGPAHVADRPIITVDFGTNYELHQAESAFRREWKPEWGAPPHNMAFEYAGLHLVMKSRQQGKSYVRFARPLDTPPYVGDPIDRLD